MNVDEVQTLKAQKRERLGSRYSKRIREQGGLPAIVYGHKQDPAPVTLEAHEAIIAIERGEKVFKLDVAGTIETVLLKDLQFDYLGTNIVHADFARVDFDERVEVTVKLRYMNVDEAPAMKAEGAVFSHPVAQLDLECTVTNLPEEIEVDCRELTTDNPITAGDVKLPKDTMVLLTPADAVVAMISIKSEVETDEESTIEAADEPERVGDGGEEEQSEG